MAVTLEEFKDYLGAKGANTPDDLLQACLDDAAVLVDAYVGIAVVPLGAIDRSYLIVATDLWARRNAPNGIANTQLLTPDGTTVARVSRDPLSGAYGILRRWVLPF